MKKIILIIVVVFATCSYSFSQEIGLRFGYYDRGGVAIDGVFSTTQFSRLHADVAFFSGGGVGIDLLWDFLYRPIGGEAFNWYVGAGPYTVLDDPFHLGIAGEIGLEYRFNTVPIAIGADYRPKLSIIEDTHLYGSGFGVNVRFVFGGKR